MAGVGADPPGPARPRPTHRGKPGRVAATVPPQDSRKGAHLHRHRQGGEQAHPVLDTRGCPRGCAGGSRAGAKGRQPTNEQVRPPAGVNGVRPARTQSAQRCPGAGSTLPSQRTHNCPHGQTERRRQLRPAYGHRRQREARCRWKAGRHQHQEDQDQGQGHDQQRQRQPPTVPGRQEKEARKGRLESH